MLLQAAWLFKAVGWKQTNSEKSERECATDRGRTCGDATKIKAWSRSEPNLYQIPLWSHCMHTEARRVHLYRASRVASDPMAAASHSLAIQT